MNIIDFEASSLSHNSFPIQVAVILENGTTYNAYIRPHDDWRLEGDWDPKAFEVHKIPMQLLLDVGKDINTVARELNDFLGDGIAYCDGGIYDTMWCNTLFYKSDVARRTFKLKDVMDDLIGGPTNNVHLWHAKRKATKELNLREHDALNDVRIIQRAVEIYRDPLFIQDHSLKPFS